MYSSGISRTVIWHAQSQLVGFVLRLFIYVSSGICNRHLACSKSISRFCFTFIYVLFWNNRHLACSKSISRVLRIYVLLWNNRSGIKVLDFVLHLYMYSSGITVIWYAQSQ